MKSYIIRLFVLGALAVHGLKQAEPDIDNMTEAEYKNYLMRQSEVDELNNSNDKEPEEEGSSKAQVAATSQIVDPLSTSNVDFDTIFKESTQEDLVHSE